MITLVPAGGMPHTGAVVVTSSSPLWYTTRATGLIALVLITASVVLGLLTSVRFARPNWPRFVTVGLHRNMSLLVLAFTGLHILTTVTDSYAHINLLAVVVPFSSSYRPIWLGLGTAAFDLLLAVTITSLLRVHVGHRLWRLVHWLAYLCWPAAIIHGLGTGTDTPQRWVLAITACCVAAVVAAAAWRLALGWQQRTGTRIALAGVAVIALAAGTVWLAGGPLRPGWARRSGTPTSLLTRSAGSAAAARDTGSARAATTSRLPAAPFNASLSGQVSQSAPGGGNAVIRIQTTALPIGGGVRIPLDIIITGQADGNGGVTMSGSQVTFGPSASPRQYTGQLVSLNGTSMTARVRDSAGQLLLLAISLQPNGNSVTGTLQVSTARTSRAGGASRTTTDDGE
jgi:sulfoxide reductase heme-binding subunit YedZ